MITYLFTKEICIYLRERISGVGKALPTAISLLRIGAERIARIMELNIFIGQGKSFSIRQNHLFV